MQDTKTFTCEKAVWIVFESLYRLHPYARYDGLYANIIRSHTASIDTYKYEETLVSALVHVLSQLIVKLFQHENFCNTAQSVQTVR